MLIEWFFSWLPWRCGRAFSSWRERPWAQCRAYTDRTSRLKCGISSLSGWSNSRGECRANAMLMYANLCAYRNEVDEDNSEHEQRAIGLRDMLIQLMEEKATELSTIEDMFLTRLKLQETTQQFKVCPQRSKVMTRALKWIILFFKIVQNGLLPRLRLKGFSLLVFDSIVLWKGFSEQFFI